ncbi:META domain-containing protein [Neptunicella sp.]|uniref:META domain-containing protein n=1 Tax=Neptunicella sp. TaxID=2125986 RepID=UPI003F68FAAC
MYRRLMLFLFICISSVLAGCASDPVTQDNADVTSLTGTWRVEDINQTGVTDYAMLTMQFSEQGRVSGSTGCNRYNASLQTDNGNFVVANTISTRRACVPAIANQEQRFLAALNEAATYQLKQQTWLIIYDGSGQPRLTLTQMQAASESAKLIADKPLANRKMFRCEQLGEVGVRFLGPETVELSINGQMNVLQRDPEASVAQYTNRMMSFWKQGNQAQLNLNQQHYQCHLIQP